MLTTWANRTTPATRGAVGCLFQPALLSVDLRQPMTFDELVRETSRAYLVAVRYAQYPFGEMKEAAVRAAAARGIGRFRTCVIYNFLNYEPTVRALPGEQSADAPGPNVTVTPVDRANDRTTDLSLTVRSVGAALTMSLTARTDVLPPELLRQFALDLRGLLLTAAHRTVRLSEVAEVVLIPPVHRGSDCV